MKKTKTNCTGIRARIAKALTKRLDVNQGWLAGHIDSCPRCQKRLGNIARVNLAFTLLRSQPHSKALFMHANTQAVNTLKHSLRDAPASEKLRNFQPVPNWFQRNANILSSVSNVAACLVILFILKTGLFSSMNKFNEKGRKSVENYYAKKLGGPAYDDIFSS